MITHKKKDPTHSYCARCDVDCADDMLLFIHQLGSSAHSKSSDVDSDEDVNLTCYSLLPRVRPRGEFCQSYLHLSAQLILT